MRQSAVRGTLALAIMVAAVPHTGATAEASLFRSAAEAKKLIPKHAVAPYKKDQWPNLFARYPEQRIRTELQHLRERAALAAAEDPSCDMVSNADYAPSQSTPSKFAVYADCQNGYRVRIRTDGVIQRGAR